MSMQSVMGPGAGLVWIAEVLGFVAAFFFVAAA